MTMTTKKSSPKEANAHLPVREGEDPWTSQEIAEQREALTEEIQRLEKKIAVTEGELIDILKGGTDGAGRDPADLGSSNFERDQEVALAQNAREMADQARLALRLFNEGNYGLCEVCENPIGKGRLQVFPRATLCVVCKQREERR